MNPFFRPVLGTALSLAVIVPTYGAELLPNGHFNSNISGWDIPVAPNTTISWDSDGLPGGSLRIDSTWNSDPATPIEVTSSCFVLDGSAYYRAADARAAIGSDGSCNVDVLYFEDTDCLIPSGYTFASTQGEGNWEHIEGDISPGVAFRVALRMIRYPTPSATCWFDNASLIGPGPSALEIPTVDRTGLAILAFSLVGIALAVLRRS